MGCYVETTTVVGSKILSFTGKKGKGEAPDRVEKKR